MEKQGGISMARRQRALPGKVDEVSGRIEQWRQTRKKLTAMPKELWVEATALARVHGVYQISQALSVNYDSLRKRVDQAKEPWREQPNSRGFVEVDSQRFSIPGELKQTMVELSRADGTRLVVQMSGSDSVDVLGLAEIVMGRRS
jgi:hypothetical protein